MALCYLTRCKLNKQLQNTIDRRESHPDYRANGLADDISQNLSDASDRDVERSIKVNERMEALGLPYYALCGRSGLSFRRIGESCNDKQNISYISPKVLSERLERTYGFTLEQIEKGRSIDSFRAKVEEVEKAEKTKQGKKKTPKRLATQKEEPTPEPPTTVPPPPEPKKVEPKKPRRPKAKPVTAPELFPSESESDTPTDDIPIPSDSNGDTPDFNSMSRTELLQWLAKTV